VNSEEGIGEGRVDTHQINRRPHKSLKAWQKAVDLVVQLYRLTEHYPREEGFGLKSQTRRAAVSVPSNIAEGLTRSSTRDRRHFLNISQASLSEIDTQLEIARRLGIVDDELFCSTENSIVEVQKLVSGLSRSLA
jgi:four helix bundle protein